MEVLNLLLWGAVDSTRYIMQSKVAFPYGKWKNCWEPCTHYSINVPARREDYTAVTKSHCLPFIFLWSSLAWKPACDREGSWSWPSLTQYMDAVRRKTTPKPWDSNLWYSGGCMKGHTHRGQITLLLDCARLFDPSFEEVSNRWTSDAFPQHDLAELIKVQIYMDSLSIISPETIATTD